MESDLWYNWSFVSLTDLDHKLHSHMFHFIIRHFHFEMNHVLMKIPHDALWLWFELSRQPIRGSVASVTVSHWGLFCDGQLDVGPTGGFGLTFVQSCHVLTPALWLLLTDFNTIMESPLVLWSVTVKCHLCLLYFIHYKLHTLQFGVSLTILGKQKLRSVMQNCAKCLDNDSGLLREAASPLHWLFSEVWIRCLPEFWLRLSTWHSLGVFPSLSAWPSSRVWLWLEGVCSAVCLRHGPNWLIVLLISTHSRSRESPTGQSGGDVFGCEARERSSSCCYNVTWN